MATQYPTALDGEAQLDTSIAPTATLGNPSHSDQHENVNGAVQALEAKLGIGASAAASSTDQMVLVSDGSGTSWGYRGVAVFADAAARDAAVISPEEGMTAYLQDSNSVTVYSGSAWVTIADLETLVVDSANGRVGIGTSSPLGALDIHGNTESLIFSSPSDTNRYRIDANITDTDDFGLSIGYWDGIASDYKRTLTVDDSGKVGIGTTTPRSEFHVEGSSDPELSITSTDASNPALYFGDSVDSVRGGIRYNTANDRLELQGYNNSTGMVIDSSGNVGIGTTLPTATLTVNGSLSKTSGSFRIPHPLPELEDTHDLVHSFVEAPEALNLYRGRAVLVDGVAIVNIDEAAGMTQGTFVALNREAQCFTTNEESWCQVRGKVVGNLVTIEAEDATCSDRISWLVCGQRQDQGIIDSDLTDDEGRIIVEPVRPLEPDPEE